MLVKSKKVGVKNGMVVKVVLTWTIFIVQPLLLSTWTENMM